MLVKELFDTREDGVKLYRSYSNTGMMIQQNETGIVYSEAIDVENVSYTYTETDQPIESVVYNANEATAKDYENALAEFGVNV